MVKYGQIRRITMLNEKSAYLVTMKAKKYTSVNVLPSTRRRFKQYCKANNLVMSAVLDEVINAYISNNEHNNKFKNDNNTKS